MNCPSCESKMLKTTEPTELVCFSVPLVKWEIRVWKWQDKMFCSFCLEDEEQRTRDAIAGSAYDDGFEKGYKQARLEVGND